MTASGSPTQPAPLSFQELTEQIRQPQWRESLSPLLGAGVLVVALGDSPPLAAAESAVLLQLPTLPCVTVALGGEPASAVTEAFDVWVENEEALAILLAGIEKAPLAALCFVQLLRSRPLRPAQMPPTLAEIYQGLVSESFVYSALQAGPEFQRWRSNRQKNRLDCDAPPSKPAEEPACRMERHGGQLEAILSKPGKHNALSRAMRDELCEALELALLDESIERFVLRGDGPSFCSGGDLDEFGTFPDPLIAHGARTTRSPGLLLAQLGDRAQCEVHGACLGAGLELPCFTRRIVAADDAVFGLPEIGLGLVPGAGGTVSLPRRIGRQRTAWLGLSGARIDAGTALDWGLVDEVRFARH